MPPNCYLFLNFQSPILGITKYIVHFISQESRDYNLQIYKKPRIGIFANARFNLTYSLWVIGLFVHTFNAVVKNGDCRTFEKKAGLILLRSAMAFSAAPV